MLSFSLYSFVLPYACLCDCDVHRASIQAARPKEQTASGDATNEGVSSVVPLRDPCAPLVSHLLSPFWLAGSFDRRCVAAASRLRSGPWCAGSWIPMPCWSRWSYLPKPTRWAPLVDPLVLVVNERW